MAVSGGDREHLNTCFQINFKFLTPLGLRACNLRFLKWKHYFFPNIRIDYFFSNSFCIKKFFLFTKPTKLEYVKIWIYAQYAFNEIFIVLMNIHYYRLSWRQRGMWAQIYVQFYHSFSRQGCKKKQFKKKPSLEKNVKC